MTLPIRTILAPPLLVNVGTRHVVALVSAASAGVHVALAPEHFDEGGPLLGGSFVVAALGTAVVALAIRDPRRDRWAPLTAFLVLGGVAAAYALSRTSGLPGLIADPEAVDPLGVLTSAAELFGAICAVVITLRKDPR